MTSFPAYIEQKFTEICSWSLSLFPSICNFSEMMGERALLLSRHWRAHLRWPFRQRFSLSRLLCVANLSSSCVWCMQSKPPSSGGSSQQSNTAYCQISSLTLPCLLQHSHSAASLRRWSHRSCFMSSTTMMLWDFRWRRWTVTMSIHDE